MYVCVCALYPMGEKAVDSTCLAWPYTGGTELGTVALQRRN